MICWVPVTLDCSGEPEIAVHYRHEVALIPPQGFIPCILDDGTESTCPLPAATPGFVTTPDTTECTMTPEPAVGEITFIRTTAIDAAGNEDCG